MKKILFITLSICTLFTACKIDEPDKDLKRIVFDPGDLKFISTSLNTKKETSSALYGNPEALASLSGENNQLKKGSVIKLVTWKYHDNPQYIGGTITGELLSIETVKSDNNGNVSYKMQNTSGTENVQPNKDGRIQYILSYRPVVRP
ncbi:cytochrome P460 family protein [Chryseobacterium herbae]|uniref:Cytochrome P460 family protein n=1 Tax=Chryseobacterium herbae TaxID=2976476 RepID=A0ABT2ITQ2_9FLAO|nr:cytochrome P460 family protein [Chryseobacterium sp. pc1-10]MCT2562215.1 cytochrome P460 family protein [Chryseobacterium sp. pc1-10]